MQPRREADHLLAVMRRGPKLLGFEDEGGGRPGCDVGRDDQKSPPIR